MIQDTSKRNVDCADYTTPCQAVTGLLEIWLILPSGAVGISSGHSGDPLNWEGNEIITVRT